MDILAHALFGATVCSRRGLAGGLKPEAKPLLSDRTVGMAMLFGILPDVLSMGLPLLQFVAHGCHGNFFHNLDGGDITVYRYTHSLIVALVVCGAFRFKAPGLFVASLAWPLHVAMDALTHGAGKFQTTVFYPFSAWALDGIRWWQHPGLVLGYWLALPAIWILLFAIRQKSR